MLADPLAHSKLCTYIRYTYTIHASIHSQVAINCSVFLHPTNAIRFDSPSWSIKTFFIFLLLSLLQFYFCLHLICIQFQWHCDACRKNYFPRVKLFFFFFNNNKIYITREISQKKHFMEHQCVFCSIIFMGLYAKFTKRALRTLNILYIQIAAPTGLWCARIPPHHQCTRKAFIFNSILYIFFLFKFLFHIMYIVYIVVCMLHETTILL